MEVARTWTHKKPTLEDIVEVFMSRSGYFNRPHKLFPKLHVIPDMKKWLENGDDAPADAGFGVNEGHHSRVSRRFWQLMKHLIERRKKR